MFKNEQHSKHEQSQYKLPLTSKSLTKIHNAPIYIIKFNQNGQYCMTGSQDRSVSLYNPNKNIMIKNYKNLHNYDVYGLDINKDNSKFVTGGGDKTVLVTDVLQGKYIRKFTGHTSRVNSVCFNMENNIIVSGSYDMTVKFWDNRQNSNMPLQTLKKFKDSITQVKVLNYEIICGCMDGSVNFYDIRKGQLTSDLLSEGVQRFGISNSGKAYVMSAVNNHLYLVQKKSGKIVNKYYGHQLNNFNVDVCFNNKDSHIISGSSDGNLYIYDIMKSQAIKKMKGHDSALSALDVHQQAGYVTAGHDGSVSYWKI